MIAVDTNILVRLLTGDDPPQAEAATRYLRSHAASDEPALVAHTVLVELSWVLEDVYGYSRQQVGMAVEAIRATAQLQVADAAAVDMAVQRYLGSNVDFADCLMGAGNALAGCEYTATFDRKTARLPEFRLVGA